MEPQLVVPPIYSPIPSAIHPRHAAIDARTADWAEEFRIGSEELRKRLVTHDLGIFAARILPEGHEEVVSILSDFCLWLFGVDDGLAEEGELGRKPSDLVGVLARLLRVVQDPEAPMLPGDPLAEGARDLTRRLRRFATPAQLQRWVDSLREYFMSVVWEASYRRGDTVPTLNDYALMRIYVGATSVVLPLLEVGYGYDLPERDERPVRALGEMTSFITTWDNDIFSYHKESRSSGYYLNALRVLQDERGLTPQQAMTAAITQRDRVQCLFLRLSEHLQETASPQLKQYLRSLAHFIRASQDWELTSVRYTTPDDPANLPSTFSDTPTDDSHDPLDIPAISWWWDLLPTEKKPSLMRRLGALVPTRVLTAKTA